MQWIKGGVSRVGQIGEGKIKMDMTLGIGCLSEVFKGHGYRQCGGVTSYCVT